LAPGLPGLVANPLKSPRSDQTHNQKVVAAKARGILPVVSVFVGPLEGNVEHGTVVSILAPDAGTYDPVADLMNGLTVGCTRCCLIFHDVFTYWFNGE
jgi:hypothetical protein